MSRLCQDCGQDLPLDRFGRQGESLVCCRCVHPSSQSGPRLVPTARQPVLSGRPEPEPTA